MPVRTRPLSWWTILDPTRVLPADPVLPPRELGPHPNPTYDALHCCSLLLGLVTMALQLPDWWTEQPRPAAVSWAMLGCTAVRVGLACWSAAGMATAGGRGRMRAEGTLGMRVGAILSVAYDLVAVWREGKLQKVVGW